MTCTRALELLEEPAHIQPPSFADDVDADACEEMSQELGRFILANMRPGVKGSLFPGDPFMHQTNALGLGFGACGVLYVLRKCGLEIPPHAYEWLEQELDKVKPGDLPPGLLTGASGIAWSIWELGLEDRAAEFMKMANESAILKRHHSYLYGAAGVGMANLHLFARTKRPDYLAAASELGEFLLGTALEGDSGLYWESDKLIQIGYGYGQSGVALFLLRLSQLTGRDEFLSAGRRALEFDVSHGVELENGIVSFPRGPSDLTFVPYLEEGSAGIAKVAMRYGMWDQAETMLASAHRKYASFAGLLYGLGSFVDVLTDAFLLSNNVKYLEMAKRPLSGIRDIYLVKKSTGSATPGDGLFRVSCDYATGVAGVLRTLHRYAHLDAADFVLDEVAPTAVGPGAPAEVGAPQHATSVIS